MNSLWILIISAIVLIVGYRYYGAFLSRHYGVDPKEKTPAHTRFDGIDFVPAKNWTILFGHHFSSIAGAGPIVGPVLAVAFWGWMPALLWILIGSIFIGGVHDFGSLIMSLKYRGNSIADITRDVVSKRARILFLVYVWLALMLVIAVFAKLCAQTLAQSPHIVIPSIGLIPLAVLLGYLMYNKGMSQQKTTLIGLVFLVILLVMGKYIPVRLDSILIWVIILFVYSYIASITPVHILLQPRDYITSFLLLFGMLFGILGILVSRPVLNAPAFVTFNPDNAGILWPMLFVTVACGAISGFHCLVASGTTAKQIPHQADACKIGYGGMLLEGGLAVIAVICVAAGLGSAGKLQHYIVIQHNPIAAFNEGYGMITRRFLGNYGSIFSATILSAFILTTLDTATRVGRYLTEELFSIKNRFLSTFIVVVGACLLNFSGSGTKIWIIFGASNQLVAALALLVISCWLLGMGKNAWFVSIPAGIMLLTSIMALIIKSIEFFSETQIVLFMVTVVLVILALFLIYESVLVFRKGFAKI